MKNRMEKKVAFWVAIAALVALAIFGGVTYWPGAKPHLQLIPPEGERTIDLKVLWGGDIYTSTETSCDIWAGQFHCELRRGGGLGTVISRTLPLTGSMAMVDPPDTGVVVTATLSWSLSELVAGPYETWCRLELTNGEEQIWGYIEGQGQELDGYCLADAFSIGQVCGVARRFQSWVQ
jgi:hypothetical protein